MTATYIVDVSNNNRNEAWSGARPGRQIAAFSQAAHTIANADDAVTNWLAYRESQTREASHPARRTIGAN